MYRNSRAPTLDHIRYAWRYEQRQRESSTYGVPVIVVPQMSEQAIVGRRVEEIGAGLYLAREDVTADTLRQSAQRLLSEDHFRRQAAVVRESFQRAGGGARTADAILRFRTAWRRVQVKP